MVGPVQPVSAGGGLQLSRDFAPGQIVRLQLVEPGINGGIVSLSGRLYRAAGVLPARPGEHFWALVEKVAADRITVKHISPAQPGRGEVAAVDLARVLGLPTGAENEQVLRELLRWKLPLDREFVLRFLAAGRDLLTAGGQPGFWPALAWLQTMEVPRRAGALAQMLAYLLGWREAEPEGQELLNRSRAKPGQDAVQVLALNGRELLQGSVYVISPDPGGQEPGDGVRFVLHCESRQLGAFWVCLELSGGGLNGRLVTPDEKVADVFRGAMMRLEEGLASLGYQVRPFTIETRRVHSVVDLLAGGRVVEYAPLDIRV